MKTKRRTLTIICGIALAGFATAVYATATYQYKPGEYAIIAGGKSPNLRYSLRSHGSGEYGQDNFHVYLMAEPGQKKIGPLTEIGEVLDTAPDAYKAQWSPDSTHVAIQYRTDRHIVNLLLYRIQKGRAFPVVRPKSLLTKATLGHAALSSPIYSHRFGMRWIDSSRFQLREHIDFYPALLEEARKLGAFGQLERLGPTEEGAPASAGLIFSVEAICELSSNDKIRIVRLQPGKLD